MVGTTGVFPQVAKHQVCREPTLYEWEFKSGIYPFKALGRYGYSINSYSDPFYHSEQVM